VSAGFLIVLIVPASRWPNLKTSLNLSSAIHLPKAPQSKKRSAPRKLDARLPLTWTRTGGRDGAELSTFMDRQNFRRWFTGIAGNEFYRFDDRWNVDQRDCRLGSFRLREALKPHDRFLVPKGWVPVMRRLADLTDTARNQTLWGKGSFVQTSDATRRRSGLWQISEFADARLSRLSIVTYQP